MAKQLVQLIIAGGQVVGKAFANALRQEIRMSQEAAKARYNNADQSTAHAAETARMGMTVDEAKMILNVEKIDAESIQKNYDHLFEVNDKSKGGSLYIQSKVVRAKERLDNELKLEQNKQGPDNPS